MTSREREFPQHDSDSETEHWHSHELPSEGDGSIDVKTTRIEVEEEYDSAEALAEAERIAAEHESDLHGDVRRVVHTKRPLTKTEQIAVNATKTTADASAAGIWKFTSWFSKKAVHKGSSIFTAIERWSEKEMKKFIPWIDKIPLIGFFYGKTEKSLDEKDKEKKKKEKKDKSEGDRIRALQKSGLSKKQAEEIVRGWSEEKEEAVKEVSDKKEQQKEVPKEKKSD